MSRAPERSEPSSAWDGTGYDGCASFVWRYGSDLIGLLAPRQGERVLDLGCGTGHLTAKIAEAGAEVLGIDASESMVDRAKANYPDLSFEVLDALDMGLGPSFDAVFSNAVLHWVTEPETAASGIFNALKPRGRFVAELGGEGNIGAIIAAVRRARAQIGAPPVHGLPWYFPSAEAYASLLSDTGFTVQSSRLFPRPTHLGEGDGTLIGWLKVFASPMLAGLSPSDRDRVCALVEDDLRDTMVYDGTWVADYVRLRIIALKPRSADDDGTTEVGT